MRLKRDVISTCLVSESTVNSSGVGKVEASATSSSWASLGTGPMKLASGGADLVKFSLIWETSGMSFNVASRARV